MITMSRLSSRAGLSSAARMRDLSASRPPPCRKERDKDGAAPRQSGPRGGATWAQQVPGFAVLLEVVDGAAAGAEGMESQSEASPDGFDGNQVPDIVGANEGGEEINVGRGVGGKTLVASPMTGNLKVSAVGIDGGFNLDAPYAAARVHHDVVLFVVAEGLGDGETAAGGLEHEFHLGEIADVFRSVFSRAPGYWFYGRAICWSAEFLCAVLAWPRSHSYPQSG